VAATTQPATQPSRSIQLTGRITAPDIKESSGLVASRRYPGVFWTHNDSGNAPILYAITATGELIARFPVKGATCRDWEDIAIDDQGHLFIGDIGNNWGKHHQLAVYRLAEPDPRGKPVVLVVDQAWQLRFPGNSFDCESLFVWKQHGFVISKVFDCERAVLYRFPLVKQRVPAVLEKVVELPIRWPCTGADISPDGGKLAVMTNAGPYVFTIGGDPTNAGTAEPWHETFVDPARESCCFTREGLLSTAETRDVVLFTDEAARDAKSPSTQPAAARD
jgi:hypothetical protein